MSQTVVINGSNYIVNEPGERTWGQNLTNVLVALAAAIPGNSGYVNIVSVTSTPISVQSGRTYLVNTSTAKTLNLPAPALNAFFHVKDVSGTAATNNITIHRFGSEQIDGASADKLLSLNNGSWFFFCDGTNWYAMRDADLIGDVQDSGVGAATNLTTAQYVNVASKTLAAGTWDLWGWVDHIKNTASAGQSLIQAAISTNTGNTTTDHVANENEVKSPAIPTAAIDSSLYVRWNKVLTASTQVFLKAKADFSAGQAQAKGKLFARLVRR